MYAVNNTRFRKLSMSKLREFILLQFVINMYNEKCKMQNARCIILSLQY